jgi:hypothetical protein
MNRQATGSPETSHEVFEAVRHEHRSLGGKVAHSTGSCGRHHHRRENRGDPLVVRLVSTGLGMAIAR